MTSDTTCRSRSVVSTITPISDRANQTAVSHMRACAHSHTQTAMRWQEQLFVHWISLNYSFRPSHLSYAHFTNFYSIICRLAFCRMRPYGAATMSPRHLCQRVLIVYSMRCHPFHHVDKYIIIIIIIVMNICAIFSPPNGFEISWQIAFNLFIICCVLCFMFRHRCAAR